MSLLAGLCLLVLLQDAPGAAERIALVAESGAKSSFKDGIFELKGGRGWLRTPLLFLDFEIEFEFRGITPETDAALLLRTWTNKGHWPDRGLRLRLPTTGSPTPEDLLVGRKEPVKLTREGQVALRGPDEWQRIRVAAEGRRIEITLNATSAGVFDVDRFGGHLMFENRKGQVQIRIIELQARESSSLLPDVMRFEELEQAGGTPPSLTHEVKPLYTLEVMRRLVQGDVGLEAVVLPDGSVGAIRVKQSLDPTLDLSAIAAVKGWRFNPGRLNGQPVPVIVHVDVAFTLR